MPTIDFFANILSIIFAVAGATLAGFWLALIIWAFRDMRLRSRDPFSWIMAAVVSAIPFVGIFMYLILRPPETLAERYERSLEEEALLQEIEKRPTCHNCSRTIKGAWVVCPTCQVELKKQCSSCASLLDLGWGVCPFCAHEQPEKRLPLNKKLLRQRILNQQQPVVQQAPAAPQSPPVAASYTRQPVQAAHPAARPQPQRVARRRYRTAHVGAGKTERSQRFTGRMVVGEQHPTVIKVKEEQAQYDAAQYDTVPSVSLDETQPSVEGYETVPSVTEATFASEATYVSEPKPKRVARSKRSLTSD